MYIGSKEVKTGAVPLIIAEAGTAHGGNLDRAYELINRAKDAGADCVKFQAVYADEIIHRSTGMVRLPGGSVDLYKSFKDRKSTRLNSSHIPLSRMPSSA